MSPFAPARLLLATFFLVSACGESEDPGGKLPPRVDASFDPRVDHDGDGVTVGGGDCDDNRADVYPGALERCFDFIDQDCDGFRDEDCDNDGDGYSVAQGDCNDNEALISPDAIEVAGNRYDDDCDGTTDVAPPPCDLRKYPNEALAAVGAMDLCGPQVLSASFNAGSDAAGRAVLSRFGDVIKPSSGSTFLVLSTGMATDGRAQGAVDPQPGTSFRNSDPNPLSPSESWNECLGRSQPDPIGVIDGQMLTLTLRAPMNAHSFSFHWSFFTSEYPEFVGSLYNDKFLVELSSKRFNGNLVFDRNGHPVTVNSSFLEVCDSSPICDNTKGWTCISDTRDPECGGTPGGGPGSLSGTGFERYVRGHPCERIGGSTGDHRTTASVTPGEIFTLRFMVYDAGDRLWDTTVLLDHFQWNPREHGGPFTE